MGAVVMLLSTIVFTGCNNEKNDLDNYAFIKDVEYTSAVIEKNNNIYLYDKNYNYLEPIGELSRFKELSALSEDSEYVAFKYVDEKNKINLYNVKNRETKVLEIEEPGEISYIQWFDDFLVVGYYENPTTNKYLVYDRDSLELINSCKGILIDVLDQGKTLVYGANTQGVTSLYVNEDIVYTFDKLGEILLGGKVSSDKREISLLTFVFNRETFEQKEYLYTGNLEDNKIHDLKSIDKPYEIYGDIKYDGDKLVILNEEEYTELVEGEFVTKDLREINPSIAENTDKLKGILKNTFKSEITDVNLSWTELGIENITWFAR